MTSVDSSLSAPVVEKVATGRSLWKEFSPPRQLERGKDPMPADETFPLSPGLDGLARNLVVPGEKILAEQLFFESLPNWLSDHSNEWVYVAFDGRHDFYPSRDEADLAAEANGLDPRQYIVRHVAEYELRGEDDDDIVW